jgi:hypothetical protein
MNKVLMALAMAAALGLAFAPAPSFAKAKAKAAKPAATTQVCKGKDAKGKKIKWSCGAEDKCCNDGGKTTCGAPIIGCI